MKKIPIIVIAILTLINCSNEPANKHKKLTTEDYSQINSIKKLTTEEGSEMLKVHCYSCHNPKSKSHDDMLAPPLAGIKYKYSKHYSDRNQFVSKMSDFIYNPTKENAVMKGPVRRFGLMPKTTLFNKEEVYQLVAFIYDNTIEYPDWFPEHFKEQHGQSWGNN